MVEAAAAASAAVVGSGLRGYLLFCRRNLQESVWHGYTFVFWSLSHTQTRHTCLSPRRRRPKENMSLGLDCANIV